MRRKKHFWILYFLCLSILSAWAERIDLSTARKVAESVAKGSSALRSSGDLSLVYMAVPGQSGTTLRSGAMTGIADYFVFNFPGNNGFAIVAGDDRVHPILGYSLEGQFNPENLPENLSAHLEYYQDQITWAEEQNIEPSADVTAEWNRYLDGTALRSGGGVSLETAKWDQVSPYNAMCPTVNGQRALTGCGATATAIIMRYHQWPLGTQKGVSVHPLASEHPEWRCEPLNYSSGYNWNSMPLTVTGNNAPEIAKLMWHIGANINMSYSRNASISELTDIVFALQDVFDYSLTTRAIRRDFYSADEWEKFLINELNAGRPVVYRGVTDNNLGHIFVCDGYDSNHYFSINWGWSGYCNGYFLLSALGNEESGKFYYGHWMMIGAKMNEGESPIYELRFSAEPESSQLPLPVGSPFDLGMYLYNSGSMAGEFDISVAIYDSATGELGEPMLENNKRITLETNYGWWKGNNNPLMFRNVILRSELKPSERLVVVYSLADRYEWQILKGASDKLYAFDKNGLASIGDHVTYTVTLPSVEGATIIKEGSTLVSEGESFSFYIDIQKGYTSENMVVKANGTILRPDATGRYTITDIQDNVVITVTGIEEESPVDIESVNTSSVKVWSANGALHIQTPVADKAYVIGFDGRIHKALNLPEGETVIPISSGAYIISVGGKNYKVSF